MTAANFGHVLHHLDADFTPSNKLAAVIGVVGEVVTTMAIFARQFKTENIVYIGSSFHNNALLRKVVEDYTVLRGCKPYYVKTAHFQVLLVHYI